MSQYLVFQLHGPMASWGVDAPGEVRHSHELPSRSALLGLLAAAAATFVLQEFVWTIEVEGNDRLPAGQIVQALEELGIEDK